MKPVKNIAPVIEDIEEKQQEQSTNTKVINFSDIPRLVAENESLREEVQSLKTQLAKKEQEIQYLQTNVDLLSEQNAGLLQAHQSLQMSLSTVTARLMQGKPSKTPQPTSGVENFTHKRASSSK